MFELRSVVGLARRFVVVGAVLVVVSLLARRGVVEAPAAAAAETAGVPRARAISYAGASGALCTHPLFAAGLQFDIGGGLPESVAIGDLDGVNGPDLAVAKDSDDVSVLLNQGDGTFAAAVAYAAGDGPISVAIGDLDGVNGPDLAVANQFSSDVSVLLNQGDGTFAAAVAYDAGGFPLSVAIGDLDGVDGLDLAVANAGSDDVSVLIDIREL